MKSLIPPPPLKYWDYVSMCLCDPDELWEEAQLRRKQMAGEKNKEKEISGLLFISE